MEDEKGALSEERRSVGPALLGRKQANKPSARSMWPPLTSDIHHFTAQGYLVAISYL